MLDPFVLTLWLVLIHATIRHVLLLIGLLVALPPLRAAHRLAAFKEFATAVSRQAAHATQHSRTPAAEHRLHMERCHTGDGQACGVPGGARQVYLTAIVRIS